jgi:GT2 family glycosyltransferase
VTLPVDRWDFGRPPSNPQVTIVVPLYGRCDFVESQLLAFSMDPAFRNDIELLYVVDDETLVGPMLETASALNNLYDVSFSVIWGHANRGYAEANNLGAGLARARNLILLNSDVFPRAPGWVAKLTAALDAHPEFGVIAPRLLFSDGGIQHAGMVFRHDTQFNVWLNDHPLLGLPPSADTASELTSRPAVTGACMACRRNEFMDLGGFDTGYLIGDFEDSDLCLKYHKVGLKAGYLPTVELTHLERQSFQLAGDPDFRHRVVLLNALRHQRRWGELIRAIMASAKEEIAA